MRSSSNDTRASGRRAVVVAAGSTTLGALPPFLLGSLAVYVREDIAFTEGDLGLAVAGFFLTSALAALPGGRLTERVGARKAMILAAATGGAASLGVAALASTWRDVMLGLLLAGVANGVAQPAANLALARGVRAVRLGMAFGIKQSAVPGATLLGGAAVPLLAATVGWRWAFGVAAAGSLLLTAIMPKDPYASAGARKGRKLREGDAPLRPLLVLAVAAVCGAAVGTSLGSFFVESATSAGQEPQFAGLLLVFGSGVGIASRLALGVRADRRTGGHLVVVSLLLCLGMLGYGSLAVSAWTPALVIGTVLAFGAGWAWPGLFSFAVVRLNQNAPAAATSITQTGVFVGGVVGPAAFGAVVEHASFTTAWIAAAVLNLLAACCVLLGRRMLRNARQPADPDQREPVPLTPAEGS